MARLTSVNVGTPTVQPGSTATTGIVKVPRAGPVLVDAEGVVGDTIADRRVHGGVDQAVYVYLDSDYEWWRTQLGKDLPPGTFGENLTVGGIEGSCLGLGDRLSIGDVVIEVTWHRTPCATFARRMGDPKWVKVFAKALRPGAYARVLIPGIVEAGAVIEYEPFAGERVTVGELMAFDGHARLPADFMRRVLKTPVRLKTREKYESLLA